MVTITLTCNRHPKYKAVKAPTTGCPACQWIYDFSHPTNVAFPLGMMNYPSGHVYYDKDKKLVPNWHDAGYRSHGYEVDFRRH